MSRHYNGMNPPADTCGECDAELEIDEPQTCYFTGAGPCGDCRNPRTNQPMNCFRPMLCELCDDEDGYPRADLNAAVSIAQRKGVI